MRLTHRSTCVLAAAALCGMAPLSFGGDSGRSGATSDTIAALEARLQRQEDVEAIRHLLREYGRALDAGDLRAYASLFAVDGEWIGGFGTVKGRDAIAPFMEKHMRTPPPWGEEPESVSSRPGPRGVHLMTNEIIEVNGDHATAWSKWTYIIRSADNKPSIALEGHYDDELVRENGQWRFKRRVVSADIPFSDPLARATKEPNVPATAARPQR
jgi:3-phenylpropionate/cinnamic acid dioxygenase small subunit